MLMPPVLLQITCHLIIAVGNYTIEVHYNYVDYELRNRLHTDELLMMITKDNRREYVRLLL